MEPTERTELPQMPSGVWQTTEPAETSPRPDYASWGSRAGAFIIDNLILFIPWAIAIAFFIAAGVREDDGRNADSLWLLGGLVAAAAFIIPFIYFAVLNGNERGQTIGKRAGSRPAALAAARTRATVFVSSPSGMLPPV